MAYFFKFLIPQCSAKKEPKPEPIDLMAIPSHIQSLILEKVTYDEFVQLNESNKHFAALCNSIMPFFVHHVHSISQYNKYFFVQEKQECRQKMRFQVDKQPKNFRIFAETYEYGAMFHLKDDVASFMLKSIWETNLTARRFQLYSLLRCDPQLLIEIVEALNCSSLWIETLTGDNRIFDAEALRNMEFIKATDSGVTDEQLLGLKCPKLELWETFITTAGIRTFLEEWVMEKREIENIIFSTAIPLDQFIFHGFEDKKSGRNTCMIKRRNGDAIQVVVQQGVVLMRTPKPY